MLPVFSNSVQTGLLARADLGPERPDATAARHAMAPMTIERNGEGA